MYGQNKSPILETEAEIMAEVPSENQRKPTPRPLLKWNEIRMSRKLLLRPTYMSFTSVD